jgi:uncharacterized protein (TIGR02466 family)
MSTSPHIRQLFVTEVRQSSLTGRKGFEALRDELEDACRMIAEEDTAGRNWCKRNAYRGYTSYASLDDLAHRASAFADLKRLLDKEVASFAEALSLDLGQRRLKLDSYWINILKPGGAHTSHIHPHSVISGTVYVSTPPGAGSLKLEDPRLAMMMAAPTRCADAPEHQRNFVYLEPEPGSVFLWESWLRHEVMPNQAKEERISISFNYAWS